MPAIVLTTVIRTATTNEPSTVGALWSTTFNDSQTIAVVATSESSPKVSTVNGSSRRVISGQISEPKIASTITTTSAAPNDGTSISGMIAAAPHSVRA